MKRIFLYLIIALGVLSACSDDDSFTTSRSHLLTFSNDTVKMDTVFSTVGSSTYTFWAYNNSGDGLRLKSVRLKNGNQTGFRVNVDGSYLDNLMGSVVFDLEVRKGDSIRVFVELTAPENMKTEAQMVEDDLVFQLESGVEQPVKLQCCAWDAVKVKDLTVKSDTVIESEKPLVVYGSGITVEPGTVLTLRNTRVFFHNSAGVRVKGSLKLENSELRGDRLDHMFSYLPYNRVSGQWQGICFEESSAGNEMTDSQIMNAMTAVMLDSAAVDSLVPRLKMTRCVVHNCEGHGVISYHSNIALYYCQLTNTLGDCLAIYGGMADVDHCTMAQFYPFKSNHGVALRFSDFMDGLQLNCRNSIVTGIGNDQVMAERNDTTITLFYNFNNCLLRTPVVKNDTVNFKQVQWESPEDSIQGRQHFVKIDDKNFEYDFHLDSLSTAKDKGCYLRIVNE